MPHHKIHSHEKSTFNSLLLFEMQIEQSMSTNEERRSSGEIESRELSKETSHKSNNGNVSSSKSVTNIASPTTQKHSRISNGNMNSNNMNSVIFPLLSDVCTNIIDIVTVL